MYVPTLINVGTYKEQAQLRLLYQREADLAAIFTAPL